MSSVKQHGTRTDGEPRGSELGNAVIYGVVSIHYIEDLLLIFLTLRQKIAVPAANLHFTNPNRLAKSNLCSPHLESVCHISENPKPELPKRL